MTSHDTEPTDVTTGALDRLLRDNDIRLAQAQRRRLEWLVERFGAPRLHHVSDRQNGGVVILLEPPTGTGAELFARSLDGSTIAVIPFGENPAFDFLKSKLSDFGTVGSSGAEGPHELWWGGASWTVLKRAANEHAAPPRIISCYPRAAGENHGRRLMRAAARLGLEADVEPIETVSGDVRMTCFEAVEFIRRMWVRRSEPLLFVAEDAILNGAPGLPSSLDCDIALHKWNRWEMSARTLYLGRTAATEALLRNWQHLAAAFPQVFDGYLLDQAWSLTASQTALDTVWLPRSYHAPAGDTIARHATIIHPLRTGTDLGPDPYFAGMLRAPRRAGRTGAGEPVVVMTSRANSEQGVMVILRDTEGSDARAVAASVEAVAGAFANDSGGFAQLEVALCPWQDDVAAATGAARLAKHRIVEIAAGETASNDLFRTLARSPAPDRVIAMTARHD
jgi:hypothetical protein